MRRPLLALIVLVTACYDRAERSYENHVDREVDAFEYQRPIAEVWPEILAVLTEHGYVLDAPAPVEGRTLMTELKPDATLAGNGATSGYRVLVRVNRIDASKFRLSIKKQWVTDGDGGEKAEMEPPNSADREAWMIAWTIAERVQPAQFAEIQARAREASERGRGCL